MARQVHIRARVELMTRVSSGNVHGLGLPAAGIWVELPRKPGVLGAEPPPIAYAPLHRRFHPKRMSTHQVAVVDRQHTVGNRAGIEERGSGLSCLKVFV